MIKILETLKYGLISITLILFIGCSDNNKKASDQETLESRIEAIESELFLKEVKVITFETNLGPIEIELFFSIS